VLAWTASNPGATMDLILARDAADTLALRRSTNPQIFRAYSTTTGPSYGYFASGVTDAGVATADTLFIGTGGAGAAMTKLALVVNGNTALTLNSSQQLIAASTTTVDSGSVPGIYFGSSNFGIRYISSGTFGGFGFSINNTYPKIFLGTGGVNVTLPANGGLSWSSSDNTPYGTIDTYLLRGGAANVIAIGGTTSSFPALKRISSGNCLQVIAADNTASAGFIVGNQALATTATDGFIYVPTCAGTPTGTPTTQTGTAPIVVDTTNNKLYFYSGGAWRDAGP